MSKDKLVIFDTTLRDGEQSPGASMTRDEKVRIAKMLEKMRVDVIEAGFAIASPGDFESVKAVANAVKESTVCSLARAVDADIDRAAEALKGAERSRIHTFIATSDFMCRIVEAVINAGASTINIPDTVGYGEPAEYGAMFSRLINAVPNADKAIFSTHCHNDLGLGVANSLAAVMNGVRQIECTINGLGERAGNAALEEVVMAVKTRKDVFPVETNIVTEHIVPTSRLVSSITGFPVQPNTHESGIHQDGVLKHRETYEIMRAEDVGWNANRIVLGKHSGRAAVKARFEELGVSFDSQDALNLAFARFKERSASAGIVLVS